MLQSRRRRRSGAFALAPPASIAGKVWAGLAIIVLLLWGSRALYRALAPRVAGQSVATMLRTGEIAGRVQGGEGVWVGISGEEGEQRGQDGLKLYGGDWVRTGGGSSASLEFFNGSAVLLDGASVLHLEEVIAGESSSFVQLRLERGAVWIETATGASMSWTLETPLARYDVPPRSQAILRIGATAEQGETMAVFASSGPGVDAALRDSGNRLTAIVIVGEGQELRVTPMALQQMTEGRIHPYDLRDILDPAVLGSNLYLQALRRKEPGMALLTGGEGSSGEVAVGGGELGQLGELLVVDTPEDGALLQGRSVVVKGRVSQQVTDVRVDGYPAAVQEGGFEKEIALPETESFAIEVRAEDKNGLLVASKTLSLARDILPPEAPRIISPGTSGSTVQVLLDTFEIVGEVSPDTTGVMVNGYQLQKFTPGKPWRYLVDASLSNVRIGENTYEVVALDRGGNRSIPARITIVWKAQQLEPQTGDDAPEGRRSYLLPGTLRILAPTDGAPFVTGASEVLIEGETSPEAAAISVNGFTLTKYQPGKTTWNYIAKEDFGNYRDGVNLFAIVARNAQGEILDVVRYTIERQ